jgi:hypothetical protein
VRTPGTLPCPRWWANRSQVCAEAGPGTVLSITTGFGRAPNRSATVPFGSACPGRTPRGDAESTATGTLTTHAAPLW